jgi:hypothetical protein
MDNTNIDKVTFGLINIKEIGFTLNEFPFELQKEFDKSNVKTGVTFELYGFPIEEKLAIVVSAFFDYVVSQENNTLYNMIKYVTKTEFKVVEFKETLKVDEKGEFFVPNYLLQKMVSEAVATTRGMLAIKLSGGFYSNIYLPVVDVVPLIDNQMKKYRKKEKYFYKGKEINGQEAKVLRDKGDFQIINPEIYRLMNQIQCEEDIFINFYENGTYNIEPANSQYEKTLNQALQMIEEFKKKPVSEFVPAFKKKG